ncbi:MAG: hypothetical protein ABIQ31_25705 [Ferruginibacter sp.]
MYSTLVGSILLSLSHAVIPNHWLTVLAIGKKDNYSLNEVSQVTYESGLAHALSTITIGIVLGLLDYNQLIKYFTHFIAPAVLLILSEFFIYQHHATNTSICIKHPNLPF